MNNNLSLKKPKEVLISNPLMKITLLIVISLFLSLFPSETFADDNFSAKEVQQNRRRVTGVVSDNNGDPLPGVTVQVVGRQGGVITDADGRYTIDAANNEELRFQFVGMKPQTIYVVNLSTINVKMVEDIELLDEVTVTAFATQKKESVVSSIETINPRELKVPSSNLTSALAGRLAGVISYQRSGEPGKTMPNFL